MCVLDGHVCVKHFIVRYIVEPSHMFPYCSRATSVGTVQSPNFKLLRSPRIDSKEPTPPWCVAWARICKRLRSPGIDYEESIPQAFVAWWASSTNRVVVPARQAGNRFLGSLKGLQIRALAGRPARQPISTRFLAPKDLFKNSSTVRVCYAQKENILQESYAFFLSSSLVPLPSAKKLKWASKIVIGKERVHFWLG